MRQSAEERARKAEERIKELEAPGYLPSPSNYEIREFVQFGEYLLIKVHYPNCTNMNGEKVLVVKAAVDDLVFAKEIDPHFSDVPATRTRLASPLARFAPTPEGWAAATKLCTMLENG